MPSRPSWILADNAFFEVYDQIGRSVSAVGIKLGGKIDYNINSLSPEDGRFENACAIRISYVLNKTGATVPYVHGQTVSDANGHWYFYRVIDLFDFLTQQWGQPDLTAKPPNMRRLEGLRGVLVFKVGSWRNATGHVTLWDGRICSDQCYFQRKRSFQDALFG